MYLYLKYNEGSQNLNENDINQINDYDYESYQNMPKEELNNQLEDMYQEGGEINNQIQLYKDQLIDATLKNIKLTNEVQKLKELSLTQSQFYDSNTDEMDAQNQIGSMFYKGNNPENHIKQIEKYEKK